VRFRRVDPWQEWQCASRKGRTACSNSPAETARSSSAVAFAAAARSRRRAGPGEISLRVLLDGV
jgi:hypothetical protein